MAGAIYAPLIGTGTVVNVYMKWAPCGYDVLRTAVRTISGMMNSQNRVQAEPTSFLYFSFATAAACRHRQSVFLFLFSVFFFVSAVSKSRRAGVLACRRMFPPSFRALCTYIYRERHRERESNVINLL